MAPDQRNLSVKMTQYTKLKKSHLELLTQTIAQF